VLFDTGRFCRHLERAYERMHERAQRGLAPEGFAVAAIEGAGLEVADEVVGR
jgi:hypothetical protein